MPALPISATVGIFCVAGRRAKRDEHGRAPQAFSLSSAARTFTPRDISRLTEDEAYEQFVAFRFAATDGKPHCPRCGFDVCYKFRTRKVFKCKRCERQFTATTGTDFADHKLSFRQLLEIIVDFALPAKGRSVIEMSKCLNISHKSLYQNTWKLREAMKRSLEDTVLDNPVEIDGAEFGGHMRPKNVRKTKKSERTWSEVKKFPTRSAKKEIVGVIREREPGFGRTRVVIAKNESEAATLMMKFIKQGVMVYADEAPAFNRLALRHPMKRILHDSAYWTPEASTNNAECFFSMLRRAAGGIYHRIAGSHLLSYAFEMCWRQDHRRSDTRAVYRSLAVIASSSPPSIWKGYYQRQKMVAA